MRYSNSYIQSFKTCPLQCYLKYEVGIEKLEDDKNEHHLVYGRAMHEALRHIYMGDTLLSAIESFKNAYPVQLDPEDHAKTQENGITALNAYLKKWGVEDKRWKVVSCEEKESFDYGQDEAFTVRLDLVMENKEYGGIYGFDHKVVGGKNATLSFDFWNKFEPNSQVTKYTSFIKSKYGDCSGFYINAIGMRWLKNKYKDSPAGLNLRMERQMFNRNETQLEIEQNDTSYWIDRIEHAKQNNTWGMNTESCRWCSYRDICKAGWRYPEDEQLISIQYTIKPPKLNAPLVSEQEKHEPAGIPSGKS